MYNKKYMSNIQSTLVHGDGETVNKTVKRLIEKGHNIHHIVVLNKKQDKDNIIPVSTLIVYN